MKKLLSIILALSLLGCSAFAVGLDPVNDKSASDFSDIAPDAWYYAEVDALIKAGGISGMPDGTFEPESGMTLAQFIKLITAVTVGAEPPKGDEAWYIPYLKTAEAAGLVIGIDTKTDINREISRFEMAQIMVNTAESFLNETIEISPDAESQIADFSEVPEELKDAVLKAYSSGLIGGRTDGAFDGTATLQRCEASAVLVRLFDESSRIGAKKPVETGVFDYTKPVPDCELVEQAAFENALFLGNSLSDGFRMYSGMNRGTHEVETGMTVFSAGSHIGAAAGKDSVYIMLGINEIGYETAALVEQYEKLIAALRAAAPEARIYVQSVLPVDEARLSPEQKQYHITNAHIAELNEALLAMCGRAEVYYLDIHSALANESGALASDRNWDGVHLTPSAYEIWRDYLLTHRVA